MSSHRGNSNTTYKKVFLERNDGRHGNGRRRGGKIALASLEHYDQQ